VQKRAFDRNAASTSQKNNISRLSPAMAVDRNGVQGSALIEPVPRYNKRKSEKVIEGANNAAIVLGRDRPGGLGSGYGKETAAGNIDIVVGRVASDIQVGTIDGQSLTHEVAMVDTNLSRDASRIYISQKTDVDHNFGLTGGTVGMSRAKAAIAIKSDAIRIIGREGIKLVTKTDKANSTGARIRTIPAIDIIAGNVEATKEPAVKGKTLRVALKDIIKRIDELNSVLDSFMTYQMEYNTTIQMHDHPDFFAILIGLNGGKCPFSPELLAAGIKGMSMQMISKHDGVMQKLKTELASKNIAEIFGADEASSTRVNIN